MLVSYASKHGSTAEVAEALAKRLTDKGHSAHRRPADAAEDLTSYDAVVLGSGVYAGYWLKPVRQLAEERAADLSERRVWLFSVGPLGPPEELKPEGDPVDIAPLLEATNASEHRIFAGKLDKSKLGFAEKALVRAVHAPEGDFRDWTAIEAYADEIAAQLA